MMNLLLSIALAGLSAVVVMAEQSDEECWTNPWFDRTDWTTCQVIPTSTNEGMNLFLYTRAMPETKNLLLGFYTTSDTYGWTALAMAGNGGMKGASHIVVRRRDEDSDEWIAEDRYSHDYVQPKLDEQHDVQLVFAQQDEGETAWAVLVPYDSCDEHNYPLVANTTTYMLWAVGNTHEFSYHKERGQFHATLWSDHDDTLDEQGDSTTTTELQQGDDDEDIHVVDLRMPNIDFHGTSANHQGDKTNPYICTMFDLNVLAPPTVNMEQGVHVTRFEPLLDGPGKDYVHHMILYACDNDNGLQDEEQEHLKVVPNCQSMPRGCSEMKWPWAIGGQGRVLPPHVGLPLGGSSSAEQENTSTGSGSFVMLQVHYYNPQLHTNVVDNSGVRVYFTTKFRPQEAGYLVLNGGATALQRPPLPAGQADYALSPFVVPSSCTAASWSNPIHLIGVAHHMHLLGLSMDISVQRQGQLMGSLRHEKLYDFNHQSMEEALVETLQPGDELAVYCHYDTTGATADVAFGESTTDEMCYTAILYYPLQKHSSYHYFPLLLDHTLCSTPGTGEFANVSACAQTYVENFPQFMGFQDQAPFTFGAQQMCNSDLFVNHIQSFYPEACPDCHETKNCTLADVLAHGQAVACQSECHSIGMSVYPNMSRAQMDYDHGVHGCEGGMHFTKLEDRHYQENQNITCIPQGDLSQVIELTTITKDPANDHGSSSYRPGAVVLPILLDALVVALLFSVSLI